MRRLQLIADALPGISTITIVIRHFFMLTMLLFFFHTCLKAQERGGGTQVRGSVANKAGTPIEKVTIKIKGKNLGSVTNTKGEFSIGVDPRDVLVITHLGYKRLDVPTGGRTRINIVLEDSVSNLENVMVVGVGYGTVRKSDLTGAVSTIKLEGVNENKVVSVPEALQGRIAGVQIITNTGEPGSGMTFNIRGKTSITGNNQPLIVIDGQPIESGLGGTNAGIALDGGAEIPPADPLASLNPNDIASMEILKDASSIAIYGRLAAGTPRSIPANLAAPITKDQFRTKIFDERGLELIGEGQRWFDLVRMRSPVSATQTMYEYQFKTVLPAKPQALPSYNATTKRFSNANAVFAPASNVSVPKFLLFPVPSTEILQNPKFGPQNTGW